MVMQQFVFGAKNPPEWFSTECLKGRVKLHYDNESNIVGATIYTATKTVEAVIGDSIILLESGLQVVPKAKAIKYNLQKPSEKEAVKESEEDMEFFY